MTTIPQSPELLKHLADILAAHRSIFKQQRTYQRVVQLVLAELVVLARHTVTQLLMVLGRNGEDWSAWYRLFSFKRFAYEQACQVLLRLTLVHVREDEPYVVAGDGTQTARSGRKIEGVGWLRHLRTPPFRVGIHRAQRWFHGAWLTPVEQGYSRAIPLCWWPAFTQKSRRTVQAPCTEWQAALALVQWLRQQLTACGREAQRILLVGDGRYDQVDLWRALPAGVTLLARSASNRALYHLPGPQTGRGRPRRYGQRAPTPQQLWGQRRGWQAHHILVRGKVRHLQVKVGGPFVRQGAPDCPLLLIVVRGKHTRYTRRIPLPFLVNAAQGPDGQWGLPLPLPTLLLWAWQRWEIEVCHRELKTNFGLGHKQCWNPQAAILSVQWSAWVYAILVLAGYRAWGLTGGSSVPTRWWRGSGRWSLTTLWRAYRASLWGAHEFQPLPLLSPADWAENGDLMRALRQAAFAAAPS